MMIKFQAIILLVVLSACVHGRQLIDAKFSSDEDNSIDALSDLFVPPYKHYAAMARFLVHELGKKTLTYFYLYLHLCPFSNNGLSYQSKKSVNLIYSRRAILEDFLLI
uniref:Putative secreted protein n=1 Tax=Lutzomyia longipalpis TaxID=7200 RepID=A0A7G3AM06_LUTLO